MTELDSIWPNDSFDQERERDSTAPELRGLFGEQSQLDNSPALRQATAAVLEALTGQAVGEGQRQHAWVEYGKIVEDIIDSIEEIEESSRSRARAHIAAILHKAFILQAAGNILCYLAELDTAEVYAFNEGFDDISLAIAAEIDTQVELLALTPEVIILKLRGILDEDKRDMLKARLEAGLPMDEVVDQVRGILLDEGEDPTEVLAGLGIS